MSAASKPHDGDAIRRTINTIHARRHLQSALLNLRDLQRATANGDDASWIGEQIEYVGLLREALLMRDERGEKPDA